MSKVELIRDLLQCIIIANDTAIKNGGTPRINALNDILDVAKKEDNSQDFLFNVLNAVYKEAKHFIKMTTATKLDLLADLNKIALKECGRNFAKLQYNFDWLNK